MLGEIDLLIRGGVIGISALTFTLLWLNPASRRKSYSVGAIAIALAGHLAKRRGQWNMVRAGARNCGDHWPFHACGPRMACLIMPSLCR